MILWFLFLLIIPVQTENIYHVLIQGHQLFEQKRCSYCHSIRGTGGKVGPDLAHSALGLNYYQIIGSLWNHAPFMKERMEVEGFSWPLMKKEELKQLLTFLYYLNYFDLPGDRNNGEKLFFEKHCILCHRENGPAPPPSDFPANPSHLFLVQHLWNHAPQMFRSLERQGLSMPEFYGHQLVDIFAFIRSRATGSHEKGEATPGDPKKGERIFQKARCIACHAIRGKGGHHGPDLSDVKIQLSITRMAAILWNHYPTMYREMKSMGISHPHFRQDEMADLLSYLYSINFKDIKSDLKKGQKAFLSKCSSCHSYKGEGGRLASDLFVWKGKEEDDLILHIWNKLPNMIKLSQEQGSKLSKLSGDDVRNITAFLIKGHPSP